MPLYEYQCDACGHRFEVIQKTSTAPDPVCPKCHSVVHKLQSAPAFQFKGTGWYVTDYGKKDSSGNASRSGGGEAKDESKSEGKGDGKNDAKSEGKSSDRSEKSAESAKDSGKETGKSASSSESSSGASSPASTPAKNS